MGTKKIRRQGRRSQHKNNKIYQINPQKYNKMKEKN